MKMSFVNIERINPDFDYSLPSQDNDLIFDLSEIIIPFSEFYNNAKPSEEKDTTFREILMKEFL